MDTQTVRIPTELKERLEGMRTHPRQPLYEVIEHLLPSEEGLARKG